MILCAEEEKEEEEEIIEKNLEYWKWTMAWGKTTLLKTAVLEKDLIFGNSMINMINSVCVFTDLKACYDC